jgi:hypothetical protein
MNRIRDYLGFAAWFLGLGTVAYWLAGMPDRRMLSPVLQVIGLLAAAYVAVRLSVLGFRRWRAHLRNAKLAGPLPARATQILKAPRPAASPPLPSVKPRSHFGLRNSQQ